MKCQKECIDVAEPETGSKITEEEEENAQSRHKKAQNGRYGKNVIYFKINVV